MGPVREKSCCFTGHRHIAAQEALWVRRRLRQEIARLEAMDVTGFLAGGAIGFDTLAAQEVLRAKEEAFPWIRLVLVLPCLGQEAKWNERDASLYRQLLRQADQVVYTADTYFKGCMLQRNRYLVDHSAHCVCYLKTPERGGTAYTVRYARQRGVPVTNLAVLPQGGGQTAFGPDGSLI